MVVSDKHTGEKKGFGYIRFHRPYHAALAFENCDPCKQWYQSIQIWQSRVFWTLLNIPVQINLIPNCSDISVKYQIVFCYNFFPLVLIIHQFYLIYYFNFLDLHDCVYQIFNIWSYFDNDAYFICKIIRSDRYSIPWLILFLITFCTEFLFISILQHSNPSLLIPNIPSVGIVTEIMIWVGVGDLEGVIMTVRPTGLAGDTMISTSTTPETEVTYPLQRDSEKVLHINHVSSLAHLP